MIGLKFDENQLQTKIGINSLRRVRESRFQNGEQVELAMAKLVSMFSP